MAQAGISMHGSGLPDAPRFLNLPALRAVEIPAGNGSGDARSLARMYAMLARGGELDGTRLVSTQSVDLFRTPSSRGLSALLPRWLPTALKGQPMSYALGYEGDFDYPAALRRFGPSPGAFGHLGAGGQIGFADPERKVSVGFVRNSLADGLHDVGDRALRLSAAELMGRLIEQTRAGLHRQALTTEEPS